MDKKEIVIIGIGRFALSLIDRLKKLPKYNIIAIDSNPETLEGITGVKNLIVGDAQNDEWLRSIGVENADYFIIGVGSDFQASSIIAANIKENFSGKVIAKSVNKQHEMILHKIGVEEVVTPEISAAKSTFYKIVNPFTNDIEEGNSFSNVEISEDISLIKMKAPSKWVGKSVKELDLGKGIVISLIYKEKGTPVVVSGDTQINEGDNVVLIGETPILVKMLNAAKKEEEE